jgi:hypothetical protein
MPAKKSSAKLAELEAENKRLAKQVKQLEEAKQAKRRHFWRTFGVVGLSGLAGALLIAGNLLFWAGNTLIHTDKYVAVTTPLIQNEEIQKAIAQKATNRLFENVDVEQVVQESLPERAQFLAPTLSSRLQDSTQQSLERLLANDKFEELWANSMARGHERVKNFVTNYEGDGTLNLDDFYQRLSEELKTTKLAFLADKPLPANVASIVLVEAEWLPVAHNLVTNIGLYETLATVLFLACLIGAVLLAQNRRRMAIRVGLLVALLMFIQLISIRVAVHSVVSSAQPEYQAAAQEATNIVSKSLVLSSRTILLVGLLIALVAWISGPSRGASAMRNRIQLFLEGRAHKALFSKGENGLSRWFGAHKRTLQWLAISVVAIIMLLTTLSPVLVFWYALLILFLVSLIELLAAQTKK